VTGSEFVTDESVERLLQASPVFGRLGPEAIALLRKELEARVVRRGDVLIHQGDEADGLYVVASGRLKVVLARDDGATVELNEIGRGEVIGELALITDVPRSATVLASRDSHLFFLSNDAFTRVVQAHPEALRAVTGTLVDKLMATIHGRAGASPATNIVVVPLDDTDAVRSFGARLAASLGRLAGDVPHVGSADAEAVLGDKASPLARAMWREHLEASHEAVVYVADGTLTTWTDECAQQADLLLLAASAGRGSAVRPLERELASRQGKVATRTELVLLHEPSVATPRGTRHWLDARHVDRHHHVRVDRAGDYDRVARLLTGKGVGVVFSGGGARGIAHVGVLKALLARDVPIDATAGASIGAIVAGAVARGDSPDELAAQLRAAVVEKSPVDLTFPTISFASGARVTAHIKEGARGLDIEDTWRDFFCVSTNLTRGALEIHTRGPGWAAVRSSFSIPGLFPPMRNDAGEVLVDGGLLDNLPVSAMRARHDGVTVVGVDVGAKREVVAAAVPDTGVVSGWRYLATNLRQRTLDNLTSLPRLLLRLTELGSLGDDDAGDCVIRPNLDGISLLDFAKFDRLVETGERDAGRALDEWLEAGSRPTS
jgi:predicted acylesterase/phospholipase RssA/CRP-like cAMP-binding protein